MVDRKNQRTTMAFFIHEVLLFLVGCVLTAEYISGNIHTVVFQAFIGVITALMAFCAGYFLGSTKN